MTATAKLRVYDNPETYDRYTVVYRRTGGVWPYYGLSSTPFHPCGFAQHGELKTAPGTYLGERINFNDLPADCQKAVCMDLGVEK